ncbi:MAG: hypothetical protein NTZ93_04900 [Candidatus Beckwithbacteria bacterium]|nr:hypothetical protein [Candidatus Beckwithbacteria bacterium]
MKAYLKYAVVVLVILVIGVIVISRLKKPSQTLTTTPARQTEQINQLSVKDRPFVTLTPNAAGNEVTLGVDQVKNATKVEYELEYQTSTLIQGAFGDIDFSQTKLPVAKQLLFGSCSKNVCKYDEGVTGGSLTLTFSGGDKNYVLKTDFNLQQMFDRQGIFTSKDVKATLDVGKTGLPNATFLIISGTMGLPAEISGEVVAGPYAFLAATSPALKSATLTIKSKEDLTGAKLMLWDGKTWSELKSALTDGQISAPVTGLGTFVVVK